MARDHRVPIPESWIKEMIEENRAVFDALARYDARYIGNVPESKARKLFPEMFEKCC